MIAALLVVIGAIFGVQALQRQSIVRRQNATDAPVQATAAAQATPLPFDLAVFVNGKLYTVSSLVAGEAITVAQPNGDTNVIRMTENGFYMQSSTCKNQDCVHQGEVTRDNWSQRLLGAHVICLPNRVDVVLTVESTDPDIPDV